MTKHSSIRSTQPADLDSLAAIIEATDMFPPSMLEEMITPFFENQPDSGFWLTYHTSDPVAVAYCIPEKLTEGTWNLLLIAVEPNHHGLGIGRELLQFVEHKLTDFDARLLLVETSGLPEFAATRAFYERCGYKKEAVIKDYYAQGDDKVIFTTNLVPGP